jgi:hypothetical protein
MLVPWGHRQSGALDATSLLGLPVANSPASQ